MLVFLEKLFSQSGSLLLLWNPKLHYMFIKVRHCNLSRASSIQSIPLHYFCNNSSNIIPPSTFKFASDLFLSSFPTEIIYLKLFFISPLRDILLILRNEKYIKYASLHSATFSTLLLRPLSFIRPNILLSILF